MLPAPVRTIAVALSSTRAGAVRVRFERGPNPAEMLVTLLACRDLEDSDRFGNNDVYVIVSVNSATQQTKTIQNGGTNCTPNSSTNGPINGG